MTSQQLLTVAEVTTLIKADRVLLLAGDDSLLSQLPEGRWIAGTAAYFMTEDGGLHNQERIYATDITAHAEGTVIRSYDADELRDIGTHYPAHGFTVLIVPGLSPILEQFAREVQGYADVFNSPLFGWIAGVAVPDIGKVAPKSFAGTGTGEAARAAAMHVSLPERETPHLDIINLFEQGDGPAIVFAEDGFVSDDDCRIGGEARNLAAYIAEAGIDTKRPLVADYNGAMINVSIRSIDEEAGRVEFFAPVFKGVSYRFATAVNDYIGRFEAELATMAGVPITISCNCILNYLYAELEGKKTGPVQGPITFGEIAYMLLNQTLVYLSIEQG